MNIFADGGLSYRHVFYHAISIVSGMMMSVGVGVDDEADFCFDFLVGSGGVFF